MYTVKHIDTESEWVQVKEIFFDHPKSMGSVYSTQEMDFDKFVARHQTGKLVGAFREGELMGFMRYVPWPNMPCYSFNSLFTKKGEFNTYVYREGHPFPPIMDFIISRMEAEGRHTWYYHRMHRPAYDRLAKKGTDLLRLCELGWDKEINDYRYDRYIEEIVPANVASEYELHRKLLLGRVYEAEVLIAKACLKPQYRPWKVKI